DPKIVAVHVAEELQEDVGRLLAGFEPEHLAVFRGVIADPPHQVADTHIVRMRSVVRHASDVTRDLRHAEPRSKVAHCEKPLCALPARGWRHKTDGTLDRRDVGVVLAVERREYRAQCKACAVELRFEFICACWRHVELSRYDHLAALYSERHHIGQTVAPGPEHYTDFEHAIASPFRLRDSSMNCIN